MASVWLVVLASSSTLYGKVPRLILKKRSRLTQQVVSFSRKHFLFGALLCNRSSAEREDLSTHVCVCVCFPAIYTGRQVRWMYQPGSHRRKVPQDFTSTILLRCMPLFFSREKDSAVPFPRRPSGRIFCTIELIILHLLGFSF